MNIYMELLRKDRMNDSYFEQLKNNLRELNIEIKKLH